DSHILHLADRIAVLVDKDYEVLEQVPLIVKKIRERTDDIFMPQLVHAFVGLASRESFWLDALAPSSRLLTFDKASEAAIGLTSEDMMGLSRLFSRVIDFKSPFTVTHSSGVATSAEILARLFSFTERDCRLMRIAGHLHDLGKLAVPVEILDKPSGLMDREFNIVKHHAYNTYRLLETIPSFDTLNKWASYHHERIDGAGYPFHLKKEDFIFGSQIMAVADVFTAITEDRSYRAGMPMQRAVRVLGNMADASALSKEIVAKLKENYDEIDAARVCAQTSAASDYKDMMLQCSDYLS
ncbi:MAG TPA: HD domain-containing phosphohydrolase, partial [Thermodesulfovibrionales bacterium]|nr:HD domain-containing phosphohydrolase [Thermodesulfovibrionales bacterium]